MPGSVAVIILQYGQSQLTLDCIGSVERYNTYPVKYVIVDNCSPLEKDREHLSQGLRELFGTDVLEVGDDYELSSPLPKATVLRSAFNDGYARGNNKGLRLAYADDEVDKILILNNDTLFIEDIIPQLVNDVDTLPDCGLVTPLLYKKDLEGLDPNCARYEGRVRDTLVYNMLLMRIPPYIRRATYVPVSPDSGLQPVQLISGSCMMGKKQLFSDIRGFDPGTFLFFEENILWEKIKCLCKKNYVDTRLKCIHLGGSTMEKHFSPALLRLSFQSQVYFVRNYHPNWRLKVALLKLTHRWLLSVYTVAGWLRKR